MRASYRVCADCYPYARPREYFPDRPRDGVCFICGFPAYVARVSELEARAGFARSLADNRPTDPDATDTRRSVAVLD